MSGENLLLVPFWFTIVKGIIELKYFWCKFIACSFLVLIAENWKKCLMLCISVFSVVCISFFDVAYKFKISRPKYLFLWCLFLTIKWVQKRVHRKRVFFLLWNFIEMHQTDHFYATYITTSISGRQIEKINNPFVFFESFL